MAVPFKHNCDLLTPEIDLFSTPPTQTPVRQGYWVEKGPTVALTDDTSIIDFDIKGNKHEYLDLYNSYIHVKAKVVQGDGSPLASQATPVNLMLHSLFSQVDVSLNGKTITPSTNTYPYKAYISTLLSYGREAKLSQLTSALWYRDTPSHMDDLVGDDNKGLAKRWSFVSDNKQVDLFGKLHVDLMFQERYILNKVNMTMRLVRSKSPFMLMAAGRDPDCKVVITGISLFIRKVQLSPDLGLTFTKMLQKNNAKYPIRRIDTKVFSVPQGNMDAIQDNLYLNQIPHRVVIGCVDTAAYNGSFSRNPYFFHHWDISSIALFKDSQPVPSKALEPNFDNNMYVRSYQSLFGAVGKFGQDEGNQLTREDYLNGYTLFAFDLTPELEEGGTCSGVNEGNLKLEIHFSKPLTSAINVIVLGEFANIIEINDNREVLFDYKA